MVAITMRKRPRLDIQLGRSDVMRLERLASIGGMSQSEVVAAALAAYAAENADGGDGASAERLDQLTRQLEYLERDQTILIEMLALFIRDYLSGTAADPEPQQERARALGRMRFEQFVEQLARHFQRGGSFAREVAPDARREDSTNLRGLVAA